MRTSEKKLIFSTGIKKLLDIGTNGKNILERMENYQIPKSIMDHKPKGKRNVSRPKRKWLQKFKYVRLQQIRKP